MSHLSSLLCDAPTPASIASLVSREGNLEMLVSILSKVLYGLVGRPVPSRAALDFDPIPPSAITLLRCYGVSCEGQPETVFSTTAAAKAMQRLPLSKFIRDAFRVCDGVGSSVRGANSLVPPSDLAIFVQIFGLKPFLMGLEVPKDCVQPPAQRPQRQPSPLSSPPDVPLGRQMLGTPGSRLPPGTMSVPPESSQRQGGYTGHRRVRSGSGGVSMVSPSSACLPTKPSVVGGARRPPGGRLACGVRNDVDASLKRLVAGGGGADDGVSGGVATPALPLLAFAIGDEIEISADAGAVEALCTANPRVGWQDDMAGFVGTRGRVKRYSVKDAEQQKIQVAHPEATWTWPVGACSKVTAPKSEVTLSCHSLVHSSPSVTSPVLSSLPSGSTVPVVGDVQNGWCRLHGGGWVSSPVQRPEATGFDAI